MSNRAQTPQSQGLGKPFPVPAPHNGLNSRESYTKLQPTEAYVLDNMLPDEGFCKVRPGHTPHQTISAAGDVPVNTLMLFKGAASQKLIAAAGDELYDVTGSPSALTTNDYLSSRWWHDNFNGFLFGVNGTDNPWRYNGNAVSDPSWTGSGLTDNNLNTIKQIRNRLWFTENNSADVWYAGIGAVTGALTKFQLSQIATGGKCIALGSWSRDAGDGADDFTVFIMDTGQVIVYQGDPATSFSLVGKFSAPMLVEQDATVKVGGELVLMTVSGAIPLTAVIAGVAFSPDALKDWGKIAPGWQRDYHLYKANAGWSACFSDGIVYFNFPTGTSTTIQYVYNTRVPAWTRYTNLPIASMAEFDDDLYFGSYATNIVFRHATGTDNGEQIVTLARQGATYPTGGQRSAAYNSFRPNIDSDGPCQVQFALDVDFQQATLSSVYDISVSAAGADWGDDWGSDWGATPVAQRRWYGVRGYGRAVAPAIRTRSSSLNVVWFSNDIRMTQGGQL